MALHRMLISAWIFGIGMTAAAQNPEPLPPGAIMQLGTTRFKHPRAIEPAYSITPDGSQFIAFLREEKKLLFWDLQTGRLVRSLKLTVRDSCLGIAWAPDGLSFALMELDSESGALREGRITVRDLGTGAVRHSIPVNPGMNTHRCSYVKFLPDGQHLASLEMNHLKIRKIDSGEVRAEFRVNRFRITDFSVSPDGNFIVFITRDHLIVWNWRKPGEPREIPFDFQLRVERVLFSPDGSKLALLPDFSNRVVICDFEKGTPIHTLRFPYILPLSRFSTFAPDRPHLLVHNNGGADHSDREPVPMEISIWDVNTGKLIREIPSKHGCGELFFSRDGKTVVGTTLGRPRWSYPQFERLNQDSELDNLVMEEIHYKGPYLFTENYSGRLLRWDESTGAIRSQYGVMKQSNAFAVSPDGRRLALEGGDDRLTVYDVETAKVLFSLPGHGRMNGLRRVQFSPDGNQLVSFGFDWNLRITELKHGKAVREFPIRIPESPVLESEFDELTRSNSSTSLFVLAVSSRETAISQDGGRLLIGDNKSYLIYNTSTGALENRIMKDLPILAGSPVFGTRQPVFFSVSSLPSLQQVLPGGIVREVSNPNAELKCVNFKTGETVWTQPIPNQGLPHLTISQNERHLIVFRPYQEKEYHVHIHRTTDGRLVGTLANLPGPVRSASVSSDGNRIAFAMSGNYALIYPMPPLQDNDP